MITVKVKRYVQGGWRRASAQSTNLPPALTACGLYLPPSFLNTPMVNFCIHLRDYSSFVYWWPPLPVTCWATEPKLGWQPPLTSSQPVEVVWMYRATEPKLGWQPPLTSSQPVKVVWMYRDWVLSMKATEPRLGWSPMDERRISIEVYTGVYKRITLLRVSKAKWNYILYLDTQVSPT